jgi:hypothetical protein
VNSIGRKNQVKKDMAIILCQLAMLCFLLSASGSTQQKSATAQQTLRILASGRGASLIHKPIDLSRVTVDGVPNSITIAPKNVGQDHVSGFWIGPSETEQVFVSLPGGLVPVNTSNLTRQIRKGEVVSITGTVQATPDDTQLKALYRLSAQAIAKIHRAGVIIEAGSIVVQ